MPLGDRGRRDGDVHDDARLPEPRAPRAAALGEQMRGDEQLVPQIFVGVAVRVARRARQRVGGGEELLGGKGDALCLVTLSRIVSRWPRARSTAAPRPRRRAGRGKRARTSASARSSAPAEAIRAAHAASRGNSVKVRSSETVKTTASSSPPGVTEPFARASAAERLRRHAGAHPAAQAARALARLSRRRLPRPGGMLLGAIASGAREGANGVGRGDGGARGRALEAPDTRRRARARATASTWRPASDAAPLHERLGVEAHERAQRLLERLGVAVRDGVVHEPHDLLHVVQLAQGDPAPGIVRAAHAVYGRGVPVAQRRAVRRAQQRHQTRVVHVHRGDGVVTRAVARRRHRGHRPDGDARGGARRRRRLRPPAPRGHARARAARNGGDRAVKPRGSCQSVPLDASKKGICRGERLALIRFSGRRAFRHSRKARDIRQSDIP